MTNIKLLKATTAFFALQSALLMSPAFAQDAEPEEAEARQNTIVVTARKTEENILDAPLSITAFGAEKIEDLGLSDINDIQLYTPGFTYEAFAGIPGRFDQSPRFRGVTVNSSAPFRQTGSVFVDGVPIINAASGIGLNELERIEVIKGPQSAFFGRNTFSGAINYITKTPSDEFGGRISATAATRELYEIAGEIEGPLLAGLSGRLSGSYRDKGGQHTNNLFGDKLGGEKTTSITGSLYYEPTDRFDAKLRVNYLENDDDAPTSFNIGQAFANCGAGTGIDLGGTRATICGNLPVDQAIAAGSLSQTSLISELSPAAQANIALAQAATNRIGKAPDDFGFARESVNVGFQFNYDLTDNITLSGTTGYADDKAGVLRDADLSPQNFYFSYSGRNFETISQEIRLAGDALQDRLNWSIGYNFLDQEFTSGGGFLNGVTAGGFFGAPFRAANLGQETVENNAIFGSLSYDLTDRTTIGIEGRYQEEDVSNDNNIADTTAALSATFDNFLPRVLLDHKLTDSTLLYATWSKGNLAGGFNASFINATAAQQGEALSILPGLTGTFDEEELEQVEIGLKHGFDNGSISVALYNIQRTDIANRFTVALPLTNNGSTINVFVNNGDADFNGVEVEGDYRFTEHFAIEGSLGYVDAEFGAFNSANAIRTTGSEAIDGRTPPRFPGFTGSLSLIANGDLGDDLGWFARLDNSYIGENELDDANFTQLEGDLIANIRAGIEKGDTRVEAFVTNLTESTRPPGAAETVDLGVAFFNFTLPGYQITLRDKRQVGLRLTHSF